MFSEDFIWVNVFSVGRVRGEVSCVWVKAHVPELLLQFLDFFFEGFEAGLTGLYSQDVRTLIRGEEEKEGRTLGSEEM